MNEYQQTLFNNLEKLVNENEAFFKQVTGFDGYRYNIYNYRLASYTDFLADSAIEARGIMFEIDENGNAIRLAALPFGKFWNLNETPHTIGLDLSTVENIEVKADGSLLSSFMQCDELYFKSKGALCSDQAIASTKWLRENPDFYQAVRDATEKGYTVNCEWTAPDNRIVLGYLEPQVIVLNVRDTATGEMYYFDDLERMSTVLDHTKVFYNPPVVCNISNPEDFINNIPGMTGIEGFVCRLKSGQLFKVKCDWYKKLHYLVDGVRNPRRLFEAVVDECVDDLRSQFYDDELSIKLIDEMQFKVDHLFNHMVNTIESFYENNKDLDRKEFAIKGQAEVDSLYFPLAMMRYLGKEINYKEFLKSKWKVLGFQDEKVELNVNN